jgi:hypothetical protein
MGGVFTITGVIPKASTNTYVGTLVFSIGTYSYSKIVTSTGTSTALFDVGRIEMINLDDIH